MLRMRIAKKEIRTTAMQREVTINSPEQTVFGQSGEILLRTDGGAAIILKNAEHKDIRVPPIHCPSQWH